jgi:hypothetical protein
LWHFLGVVEVFKFPFRSGMSSFIQSADFNSTQHKLQSTRPPVLIALLDRAIGPLWGVGASARLNAPQEHPCKILLSVTQKNAVDLDSVGRALFFMNIEHAPLHSNITCFRVEYSQYGYIYLQLMYSFFCFLQIQQVYFRFSYVLLIALIFYLLHY